MRRAIAALGLANLAVFVLIVTTPGTEAAGECVARVQSRLVADVYARVPERAAYAAERECSRYATR